MLYHYTKEKGLLDILNSKCIWLVSSSEMSDISDRFYGNLFATIALLKSQDKDVILLRNKLSEGDILDMNMKSFELQFYSASFCNRNDNEYLWQNYADNNSGVSIEIDEEVLDNYFLLTIKNNYDSLDDDGECNNSNNIVEQRKVLYDYPIKDFETLVTKLKPDDYCMKNDPKVYKYWFFLVLCVLAGTVKAKTFSDEEEIRLLFQNKYSEEYINKHSFFNLAKEEYKNVLSSLGIDIEKRDNNKKRMELRLESVFNSKLIPTIIVGNDYKGDIEFLKTELLKAGLKNTKVIDRKGNLI